jgi:hypothetical protein
MKSFSFTIAQCALYDVGSVLISLVCRGVLYLLRYLWTVRRCAAAVLASGADRCIHYGPEYQKFLARDADWQQRNTFLALLHKLGIL